MNKRNWQYLKYVIRHKWFVLLAGIKIGAPLWRLIIHDWSKFLPSEWKWYAYTFYDKEGNTRYKEHPWFNKAWNHHQKRNKHHWQYWVLIKDSGEVIPQYIPEKYRLEMVADWMGAGRAITGKWEVKQWYAKNKNEILLEELTRKEVEKLIR